MGFGFFMACCGCFYQLNLEGGFHLWSLASLWHVVAVFIYGIPCWSLLVAFGIFMAPRGGLYLWHVEVVVICGLWHLYGISWWLLFMDLVVVCMCGLWRGIPLWFLSMASRGCCYLWSLALYRISWWCLFMVSRGGLYGHLVVVLIFGFGHLYDILWCFLSMASCGGFCLWSLASLSLLLPTASHGGF